MPFGRPLCYRYTISLLLGCEESNLIQRCIDNQQTSTRKNQIYTIDGIRQQENYFFGMLDQTSNIKQQSDKNTTPIPNEFGNSAITVRGWILSNRSVQAAAISREAGNAAMTQLQAR